jgi:MYXO-CTERM domain-containing protein
VRSLSGQAVNRPADDRVDSRVVGTQQVAADSSDLISRYLVSHPADARSRKDRVDLPVVGTGNASIVSSAPDQGRSFWGAFAVALGGFALIRHRRSAHAALQG